jgi:FKBP-type peptidyl-prolyl cis-trans isomerase
MKQFISAAALFLFSFMLLQACDTPEPRANLNTNIDSVSYSIGYLQGRGLTQEGIDDLDFENFMAGFKKAIDGEEGLLENMAMQMLIQQYFSDLQMQQEIRRHQQAETSREEGRQFLEENAQREGVTVTESGLQYRVIEEGDGPRPSATDEVEVHYRGTLITGEEFDSSYARGEPVSFPLNRVITGWTEGVQLMSVGSTYEFFIPADLGYGDNPPPGSIITPGAVLIFEVELLDILD